MDYRKRIKEYGERIKNEETIKFVDFLDVLFEWIDDLIKTKRLTREQEKGLMPYYPHRVFEALDVISPTEISKEAYEDLKNVLMKETSDFLIQIVAKSKVRMVDFDRVQFNLYAIFGKEQIASLVEHVRDMLEKIILEQKAKELEGQERKKREEGEWLRKVRAMPKKEMNKLILGSMFDFTPSARTHEERLESIEDNRKTVASQKKKFRNFELKLSDATKTARVDAQNTVYRQIGKVKRGMADITSKFKEKAKEFVSEEGPKRKIRGARTVILKQKMKLKEDLKDKGKDWKKHFRKQTKKAQDKISKIGTELDREIREKEKEWKRGFSKKTQKARNVMFKNMEKTDKQIKTKRKEWKDTFREETEKARAKIDKEAFNLKVEEGKKKKLMKETVKGGLEGARERMSTGKQNFEVDVIGAKKRFGGKEEEIGYARQQFVEKRDIARESFLKRGPEVEMEIYGSILKERKRFEKERGEARKRFKQRAVQISRHGEGYISGKRGKFKSDRTAAQEKFLARAAEIKGAPRRDVKKPEFDGKKVTYAVEKAKGKIGEQHKSMMESAKINQHNMQQKVKHRRDLFLYDVRFAKHNMQKHAKQFGEKSAAKREEFKTRQEQIIRRHKAHQKAHIIRNLLRTIRTMQVKQ